MTKKRAFISIFIIILLGTGYFLISDDSPSQDTPQQTKKEETPMDAEAQLQEAAVTLYSEDETTRWELKSDSIEHFSNSQETKLHGVRAEVYQKEEKVLTLSAEEGTLDTKTGFLALEGAITIQSGAKVIKADHLNWNSAKNELTGYGDVLLKQQGLKIRGKKFISQVDLKRLRVLENVHLTSQTEDDSNEE